jgi:ribonuclease-3
VNRRAAAITALEERLNYVFLDRALLERALTHASAGDGSGKLLDNDRLEFLGDRVLGLVMAERLMSDSETADAGDLSKRFHGLVSGQACARVARAIGLGDALRLQGGESRRGARDHDTILADGCEALIAALYIERGLQEAASVILRLWAPLLDEPVDLAAANPKSELQEWIAAQGKSPPVYRVLHREGPDHQPLFSVEVAVDGAEPITAVAGSVRAAEKSAALALLRRDRKDA